MSDQPTTQGTLEETARALGMALADLSDNLLPDQFTAFLVELGLEDVLDLSGDPLFQQKLADGIQSLAALLPELETLFDALGGNDPTVAISAGQAVFSGIVNALKAMDAVATDLKRAAASTSLATAAEALATELVQRVLEYAIVCQLERTHPIALALLELLCVVERTPAPWNPDTLAHTTFNRRLYLNRLPGLVSDPLSILRTGYGWGTETLQLDLFFERLGKFLLAIGVMTGDLLDDTGQPALGLDLFSVVVDPRNDRHPPGVAATLSIASADSPTISLISSSDWKLNLELDGTFQAGLALLLLPPAQLELVGPSTPPPRSARLHLQGQSADATKSFVIFSIPGGSRLEAKQVDASFGGDFSGGTSSLELDFTVTGGRVVLTVDGADGFLKGVIPGELSANFDVGISWSPEHGLTFHGSAGLDATLPVNTSLGPLTIPTVHLGLQATDAALVTELSASVSLDIGPLRALVDRMGIITTLSFPSERGNLGVANVGLAFKPPSGVGLVIDTAGVSGGGFLSHDDANHEYSGVLQLQFTDLLLQAFGLITTQVAGGQGYSLLALIDADFPPVQLGWGFTLNGVGGLLAVHRTASVDALHAALKADKLGAILFPKNAITNAPQILADLDTLFPTAPGRFLFGPMALVGWGTPTLLTVALAVIIELPEPIRIILLARLAVHLPSESDSLVRINMDALGVLDLGQDSLSLDATLFDSRLLKFALSGDMALRANWGGEPREFLLSVGGFHPRFTPPTGFPTLKRMSIDMTAGSIAKLHLESYLAITSNTLQIGANLHLLVKVSAFSIDGHLGFDALFQRNPFHFDGDISGSVAVSVDGDDLLSVSLDAMLTGPAPWQVSGSFKVHIIFVDVSKSFSHTWGDSDSSEQIAPVDVGALLNTELADPRSWGAQLAAGTPALISSRAVQNATGVVAHPLAQLEVHERTVPLGMDITRFGGAPVTGASNFAITDFRIGGTAVPRASVQDDFAAAQFLDLTDDEKLAQPSFELHDAGVRLSDGLVNSGAAVNKTITYETFYVDEPGGELRTDPATPPRQWLLTDVQAVLGTGSAARATILSAGNRRYTAPGNPIQVADSAFVLVNADTLAPVGVGPASGSVYSNVQALMNQELKRDPSQREHLQIVATHEMAAA